MADSPNENKPPRPAHKPKRARRTTTPRRSNSTTPREELLAHYSPEDRQIIKMIFSLTPLQFLEFVIRIVLRDRVTDEEVRLICNLHFSAIAHWHLWDK